MKTESNSIFDTRVSLTGTGALTDTLCVTDALYCDCSRRGAAIYDDLSRGTALADIDAEADNRSERNKHELRCIQRHRSKQPALP